MNILIVGNGFDLSHYLPTKYDHFMVAMGAIESWDELKGDMGFDDLFGSLYEKESYFFGYTKAMYKTDEIKISIDQIKRLKIQLKENVWYQYFSDHVREVKTWIDFETKIYDALNMIANFVKKANKKYTEIGNLSTEICFRGDAEKGQIFITREYCNVLTLLGVMKSGYYLDENIVSDCGRYETKIHNVDDPETGDFRFYINDEYLQYRSGFLNIKVDFIFQKLQFYLDDFIIIFNMYLEVVISKLNRAHPFSIVGNDWIYPDIIYSFNYTNTYQRIHDSVDVEYLHGSHSVKQNIVLGVSDLEDETLKALKVYGFTKYHQKLFKDTDYLFLDVFKEKIKIHNQKIEDFERDYQEKDKKNHRKAFEIGKKLNLNFHIWGHSLDVSDKNYILDLFSLNDDTDRNVRVTIYYFNKTAKFDLLNNLLVILGKDKVEIWMKKKWLQFKENPKITTEDAITLKDLPKK